MLKNKLIWKALDLMKLKKLNRSRILQVMDQWCELESLQEKDLLCSRIIDRLTNKQ